MEIDSVVYVRVFDPKSYTYGVENPVMALQNLTATTLRSVIGDMNLDETLSSRDKINASMEQVLDVATDAWGLKVTRVEIKDIRPPREIMDVMATQMKAERERRETLLQAQAHEEAVVATARGDKNAAVLAAEAKRDAEIAEAEGHAKAITMVYEAEAAGLKKLQEVGVDERVLRLKALDALRDVADGQATKIYLPTDLAGSLTGLCLAGDAMETSQQPKAGIPRDMMRQQAVAKQAAQQLSHEPCMDGNASMKKALSTSAYMSAAADHGQPVSGPQTSSNGKNARHLSNR